MKRPTPPDPAKSFPHNIRFRLIDGYSSRMVEEALFARRQAFFSGLEAADDNAAVARPESIIEAEKMRSHEDWWYVTISNAEMRERVLKYLRQEAHIVGDIQTIAVDELHPVSEKTKLNPKFVKKDRGAK